MKDQFLYFCQFLLLGYKLFKSHPFKKQKIPQPCLPLRSLAHSFFFFSFIAISLLSWSLHLFTFYLHLSSLRYGFHVHHVPKTTLIRVTRGLLIIIYNDIFLHDFRVDYFLSPWNHFFGFLIWLFLWRRRLGLPPYLAYYFIASRRMIWMGGQLHVCEWKSTEEVMEVDRWDRVMSIINSKFLGEASVHAQRLPSLPSNLSCVFSLWRNLELPLIIDW